MDFETCLARIHRDVDNLMIQMNKPELIVGVEMAIGRFWSGDETEIGGDPIPGKVTEELSKIAKQYGIYFIPGSMLEVKESNGETLRYNSIPIFNPQGELIDVYRKLSWDYRTNNPCRLGKKIIIENLLYRWSNGRVTLDCSGREALDDLVRPFYLLEGRNVPDFRSSIGAQYGEFLGNGDNVGKLLEGEYFTVRGYQKGTVHIVFKRPDLVEKLNDIIARHYPGALPPRV